MYLHVKASPAFEGDAAKVTWNFDGLDTKLADAKLATTLPDRYVPVDDCDHDCAEGTNLCHRRHA